MLCRSKLPGRLWGLVALRTSRGRAVHGAGAPAAMALVREGGVQRGGGKGIWGSGTVAPGQRPGVGARGAGEQGSFRWCDVVNHLNLSTHQPSQTPATKLLKNCAVHRQQPPAKNLNVEPPSASQARNTCFRFALPLTFDATM